MPRLALALLVCAVAASPDARAQRAPSAEALLASWLRGQAEAARGVVAVELAERSERRIGGPRGETVVETRARVVHRPGERPERRVEAVRVDGREVPAERLARLDVRLGRAFGPTAARLAAPPLLPAAALATARSEGAAVADRVGGAPAWRLALYLADGPSPDGRRRTPPPALAWFSRDAEPRLLRVRFAAGGPRGEVVRTVDAARADGLDLPVAVESRADVRQTRRLRDYAASVVVTTTYGRPVVRR